MSRDMSARSYALHCVCHQLSIFSIAYLQEQYVFLHDALLEYLLVGNATISSSDLITTYNQLIISSSYQRKSRLEEQYDVSWTQTFHVQFREAKKNAHIGGISQSFHL